MENNGDEPAFASMAASESTRWSTRGLSKREYFAGLAMQGLLARPDIKVPNETIAMCAVALADALLGKLANTKEG